MFDYLAMEAKSKLSAGLSRIPAPKHRASGDFNTLKPRSREQLVFPQPRPTQRASWAPRDTNHRSRSEQKFIPTLENTVDKTKTRSFESSEPTYNAPFNHRPEQKLIPTLDKPLYETETLPQTMSLEISEMTSNSTKAFDQSSRPEQQSITTLDKSKTRSFEVLAEAAEVPTLDRRLSRSFEGQSFEASTPKDMPLIDYSAPTDRRRSNRFTNIGKRESRSFIDPSKSREVVHLHRRESRRMEVEDRVDSMNRMHAQLQEKCDRLSAQNIDLKWALEQERKNVERKNWEIHNLTLTAEIQEELESVGQTDSDVDVEELQEKLAIESTNRQKFEDQVQVVLKCMESRDEKIKSLKEELETAKEALKARGRENQILIQKLEKVLKDQQMEIPKPLSKQPAWKIWRSASTKKRR